MFVGYMSTAQQYRLYDPGSDDEGSARVENHILAEEDEEEEEEEAVDWEEAEEVLAPFWLRKPQIDSASGREHSSGDVVMRPVPMDRNREPYMLSRLSVEGKGKF